MLIRNTTSSNQQSEISIQQSKSLPLHLMHRMPAQARAVLLYLNLLRATGDLDLRSVVQVTGFGALQPHHFSAFFCHFNTFE
jgi:hypothetical protein